WRCWFVIKPGDQDCRLLQARPLPRRQNAIRFSYYRFTKLLLPGQCLQKPAGLLPHFRVSVVQPNGQEFDALLCWLSKKNFHSKRPERSGWTGEEVFDRGDHKFRIDLYELSDRAGRHQRLIVVS